MYPYKDHARVRLKGVRRSEKRLRSHVVIFNISDLSIEKVVEKLYQWLDENMESWELKIELTLHSEVSNNDCTSWLEIAKYRIIDGQLIEVES